jgi:hypothetical protein
MTRDDYGVWEITLKAVNGKPAIEHGSKVKVGLTVTPRGDVLQVRELFNAIDMANFNRRSQWKPSNTNTSTVYLLGSNT